MPDTDRTSKIIPKQQKKENMPTQTDLITFYWQVHLWRRRWLGVSNLRLHFSQQYPSPCFSTTWSLREAALPHIVHTQTPLYHHENVHVERVQRLSGRICHTSDIASLACVVEHAVAVLSWKLPCNHIGCTRPTLHDVHLICGNSVLSYCYNEWHNHDIDRVYREGGLPSGVDKAPSLCSFFKTSSAWNCPFSGRLEVGAARRQTILQHQNKTIKELEVRTKLVHWTPTGHLCLCVGIWNRNAWILIQEQMANKMKQGRMQGDWQVDHLIHQHQNQMEHLNDKLQEAKERQEQILAEKLQAKKLKKERWDRARFECPAIPCRNPVQNKDVTQKFSNAYFHFFFQRSGEVLGTGDAERVRGKAHFWHWVSTRLAK